MRIELINAAVRSGSGTYLLGPLTLALGPGLTALSGPNGAGKSTFLKALCGLFRLSEGRIRYLDQGKELTPMEVRLRLGYVPQELAVHEDMTLQTYLSYIGEMKCLSRHILSGEIRRTTGFFGLEHLLGSRIRDISDGQQRRLMIAQSLLGSPRLLLMDEPFAGLDLEMRRRLHLYLQEYACEMQALVLISTHHSEEIVPYDYTRTICFWEGCLNTDTASWC